MRGWLEVLPWKSLGRLLDFNTCYIFDHFYLFLCFFLHQIPVRLWDIRPFAPSERQLKLLEGAQHSFEKVGPAVSCPPCFLLCRHWELIYVHTYVRMYVCMKGANLYTYIRMYVRTYVWRELIYVHTYIRTYVWRELIYEHTYVVLLQWWCGRGSWLRLSNVSST